LSNNFQCFWDDVPLVLRLKFDILKNDKGQGSFPTQADEIAQ